MGHPTDAGHRYRDCSRLLLGAVDELLHRCDAGCRIDGNKHRLVGNKADWQKIARQLHWQIRRHRRQGNKSGTRRSVEGVTVARSVTRGVRSNTAVGAGVIYDRNCLSPHLAQAIGNDARGNIDAGASTCIGDDGYRPFGIVSCSKRSDSNNTSGEQAQYRLKQAEAAPMFTQSISSQLFWLDRFFE